MIKLAFKDSQIFSVIAIIILHVFEYLFLSFINIQLHI